MVSLIQRIRGLQAFFGLHSRTTLLAVIGIVVALLVLPPLGGLVFSSFRFTEGYLPFEPTSYTIANYTHVFTSNITYRLFLNTVLYAVGSVAFGLAIATTFAWFLERTNVPFRRTMFVMIIAPLGTPMIISTMAWTQLANPANGLLNIILRAIFDLEGQGPINIYSITGMAIVTGLVFAPLMYLMISGVFSRVDPSLEEAGRTSGAGSLSVFRRVSLPLLSPALLSAVIYYMVVTMETFEIPAMLGMPRNILVFSSGIYYAINPIQGGTLPEYGRASVYGVVLLVISGVLIYFYGRYIRHAERFTTVTGRGYRPRLIDLGQWKYVPTVLMFGYFAVVVVMPLLILFWTSLAPHYRTFSMSAFSQLSFDAYQYVLNYPFLWIAIKNTLIISITVPTITMLLVTLVAWLSVRGMVRGAWVVDRLTFVILGVPGIVLAMILMFIYAPLPFPIYGTIWVIVIAGLTRSLPFGTRLMTAAFLQLHKELEEAATTSGAGMRATFFRIVLPLLLPSFARGFLWFFVASMRDTTMALVLYTAGTQTIAVTLWLLWIEDIRLAEASAIAVPMMLITITLSSLVAERTMLQEGT